MLWIIGAVLIFIFLKPFPHDAIDGDVFVNRKEIGKKQLSVLKSGTIWLLALSSAFMYISRYAVNSWGVYYFEVEKHYSIVEASGVISISSICGIIGTVFSGLLSDKLFRGKRYIPACLASFMNLIALYLFLYIPDGGKLMDIVAMVLFGISIGILICYLGGLMAAGIQDILSGFFIESKKQIIGGVEIIDFSFIRMFWILSAMVSLLLLICIYYKHHRRV